MGRSGRLWLYLGFLLVAQPLAAQSANEPAPAPVGSARVVVAEVSAQAADAQRRLAVEDAVRFQELISTAEDSAAALALVDGTELAMGEHARVRLDEFVLSDGPDASLTLQVHRGALRMVTGSMPKPAYRINAPSAALTVRGTVFDLAVGADGSAYVAVDSGAVAVSTASGQNIDVAAGQSLDIDSAGIAGQPRPTPATPVGALPAGSLPGMIADMDLTLAEHIAGLDTAALPDLAVLGPSRTLARDLTPGGLPGKPGFNGGNLPDKKGPGDKGNKGKK